MTLAEGELTFTPSSGVEFTDDIFREVRFGIEPICERHFL